MPEHVKGRRHAKEEDYIVFEAGTHTEAIKLSYRDYEKIMKPDVKDLAIKIQPMKGM
jgi:prolyl-tRNA editing enzyme YbaK/EbsC (Cys-tRNA(Pro) deacylase)